MMTANTKDSPEYPIIGSLCTGYGGLDMGVLAAFGGGRIAWVAETDPHMNTLLQHRIPSLTNLGDINVIDWKNTPGVNILTAGFPCQDISSAGKRKGLREGNRSGLFYRVMDAIRVLRPDYVILENVAALRWKNGGLGDILTHLAQTGYDAFWTSLRASDIGAPHRRERIFILAIPDHLQSGEHRKTPTEEPGSNAVRQRGRPIISHARRFRRHPDWLRSETPQNIRAANQPARHRDTISPESAASQRPRLTFAADSDSIRSDAGITPQPGLERTPGTHRRGHRTATHPTGGRQPQEPSRDPAATLRAGTGTGHRDDPGHDAHGTDHLERSTPLVDWGVYEAAIRRWESILSRPAPHPTEPGRTGRPRLSPAFVEWTMGLPETWVTGHDLALPRTAQLQALGNGVVPQQATAALLTLLREHDHAATTFQRRAA